MRAPLDKGPQIYTMINEFHYRRHHLLPLLAAGTASAIPALHKICGRPQEKINTQTMATLCLPWSTFLFKRKVNLRLLKEFNLGMTDEKKINSQEPFSQVVAIA